VSSSPPISSLRSSRLIRCCSEFNFSYRIDVITTTCHDTTRRLCRWDETKAPGSVGLEQSYEYVDMLGVCAWLNILVRKSKDVGIACIAQSVNVVSIRATLAFAFPLGGNVCFSKMSRGVSWCGLDCGSSLVNWFE
jgi:hypothetical protein